MNHSSNIPTEAAHNKAQSILDRKWIVRSIITVLVLAVLYILIRRLSGVLLPFLISFVVAYMLAPIVKFFQETCRLKNRLLSILVTLLLISGIISGVVAALVPAISKQATSLSQSIKHYINQGDSISYFSPEFNAEITELIQSLDIKALLQSDEIQKGIQKQTDALSVTLHSHARGSAQGGGDGGEYRNHEVQDFLPKFFFVHGRFLVMSYEF